MLGMSQIERSLELITDNGAAALDLKEYGIAKGLPARCIVQQGQTPYEVLMGQQPVLATIRDGKLLIKRDIIKYDTDLCL
jgi:cytosine deaminase